MRMRGLNVGSGQRPFISTHDLQWINVDTVPRDEQSLDLVCDGRDLPYLNGTIDYVVLHHVLEHFGCNEGDDLIREAFRVLKPTGSLLVFVPNCRALAERWLQGQLSTQLFLTNMYGAYMGSEEDRHRWGYDNVSLHGTLSKLPWSTIALFSGRKIPGADIAQDWWILGSECIRGTEQLPEEE